MKQSWICPKCGRVYGPSVSECAICNAEIPIPQLPYPSPFPPYPYVPPFGPPFGPPYGPYPFVYPPVTSYWG